jgi:hypothetical protein
MRPIDVELEFPCASCGEPVYARVRCSGKGLAEGPHTVAAVRLPCPHCDATSRVCFQPCGVIVAVDECPAPAELEPSIN